MTPESHSSTTTRPSIGVALVLVGFPAEQVPAFKYFLLLLNRLQRTFEFAFYDSPADHPLVRMLNTYVPGDARFKLVRRLWRRHRNKLLAPPADLYPHLLPFAAELKRCAAEAIKRFDLATAFPSQVIVITRITLSNYH